MPDITRRQLNTCRPVHEPCYAKTGHNIFVIVISKEGLTGTSLAKPSFGMTLTITHLCLALRKIIKIRPVDFSWA